MKNRFALAAAALLAFGAQAQKGAESSSYLIQNAKVHVGDGSFLEIGHVAVQHDQITYVGTNGDSIFRAQKWDLVIDATGQHLYPGFVATNSTLGLTEVDAIRATNDFREIGQFNPHVRAQIAFNTESVIIPTVRANGICIVQATPRGEVISGTSSVLRLSGWNWEDATIAAGDGIHVNWPSSVRRHGWWAEPGESKENERYTKEKTGLDQFFALSQHYASASKPVFDQRLESMRDLFTGKKRVYFHCESAQEVVDIADFVEKYKLQHAVLVGATGAVDVAGRVRSAVLSVLVPRVHSLPDRNDDAVTAYYTLPARLHAAGIPFALQNEGDMEAMNTRNLPFLAGSAVAYGLPYEAAVRSLTLSACEILGIDREYGSLVAGKKATLFLSAGDALDMLGNNLTVLMIDGEVLKLETHQDALREKFEGKYR